MESTDRKLLRLHVEAVWYVQLPALIQDEVELLPESSLPRWKLCAAKLGESQMHIWRPDVSVMERAELCLRVNEAMAVPPEIAVSGVNREVALALRASPRLDVEAARRIARPLTIQDRPLVADFPDYDEDYFQTERYPFIGVVIDGRLLSLAHSSRRTKDACELGIDTLLEARRKGYALAATILWAQTVKQEGTIPLYSARADNTASFCLADAAGYRAFAHIATFEGTQ
ncbi:MAG: GNAT family N-acetyltransferase [Ktedonobacteraceae bacterium]